MRIHTHHNNITEEHGEHNHAVKHGKAEVEKAQSSMKCQGRETEESTRRIVQPAVMQVPVEISHLLPNRETLARNVRRHRLNARRVEDELTPFRVTQGGDPFLLIEEEDLHIFAAENDLKFLSQCKNWFADGTFRVTPQGFDQLYTIHGFYNNRVFPCVYALLPGRSKDVYCRFLTYLRNLQNDLNPDSIVTDFETAAIQAFQQEFPRISITGCMFHFGQCIWRKLQAAGFTSIYNNDPSFALKVKRLLALSFIPTNDVIEVYESLINDDSYHQLDSLVDYFEDNFIGRKRTNRRAEPRFPIEIWNQYRRVLNKLPRSNNSVEGWHNAFNNSVGIAHPTLAALARKLKIEQHNMVVSRQQISLGSPAPKKKKIYEKIDDALLTIVADYNNRDVRQYLTDISSVLNINVI
jgi:hypothetical protein